MGARRVRGLRAPAAGRDRARRPCRARRSCGGGTPSRPSTSRATSSTRCWSAGPALSLWRAPTDNDRIGGMAARWAELGVDRLERRLVSIERDGATTVVSDTYATRGAAIEIPHEARYTRPRRRRDRGDRDGRDPRLARPTSPVSGRCSRWRPGSSALRWFGSGPHETYPDRKRGGLVGVWESTVTEQYVPYVRPQENGGHADVRWLELTDDDGNGLRIELAAPAQVSATHLRAADLAAATHDVDVVPVAETIVQLDAAHRGLGTASCGPDTLPAVPPRARARTAGPGRCATSAGPPDDADHLVGRASRVPPPQRPDQLRHARPRGRRARPPPFRRRAGSRSLAGPRSDPPGSPASRTVSATRSRSNTRRPAAAITASRP